MTAPSPDLPDLVVRRDEDVAPENEALEGAGFISSWADLSTAHDDGTSGLGYTANAAAAALDTLGAVMNPLQGLLSAAVGWIIEHVWWLHEPLDYLAGDPIQIQDQARTWENVARELRAVAADYLAGLGDVPDWQGAAADAYRGTVRGFGGRLEEGAHNADAAASQILASGVGVATVRSLIRDLIANFVAEVIFRGALALGGAIVTAGASLAAFVTSTVLSAVRLATNFAQRIARLLTRLGVDAATLTRFIDRFEDISSELVRRTDDVVRAGEAGWDVARKAVDPRVDAPWREYALPWLGDEHQVRAFVPWRREVTVTNADVVADVLAAPIEGAKQSAKQDWQAHSRTPPEYVPVAAAGPSVSEWQRKVAEEAGR